jgi:transcriptional regulator with XRE-family HTH domain
MRPSRNTHLIEALAATIKARRNELGMTQEDLAGAIDIDRPYITLMESARKQPTLSVLWRVAEGLDLTAAELMTEVDARYRKLLVAARKKPPVV